MFEIKFRIVDDFKALRTITEEEFDKEYNMILGYIQVYFGEHEEGGMFYHENPLRDGEEGDELIDSWFYLMLEVVNLLDKGYDYVAMPEIEFMDRWIEFRKSKDDVIINVGIGKGQENKLLITEKGRLSYVDPVDFTIEYDKFRMEVYEKASRFLMELKEINPRLLNTKRARLLMEELEQMSRK